MRVAAGGCSSRRARAGRSRSASAAARQLGLDAARPCGCRRRGRLSSRGSASSPRAAGGSPERRASCSLRSSRERPRLAVAALSPRPPRAADHQAAQQDRLAAAAPAFVGSSFPRTVKQFRSCSHAREGLQAIGQGEKGAGRRHAPSRLAPAWRTSWPASWALSCEHGDRARTCRSARRRAVLARRRAARCPTTTSPPRRRRRRAHAAVARRARRGGRGRHGNGRRQRAARGSCCSASPRACVGPRALRPARVRRVRRDVPRCFDVAPCGGWARGARDRPAFLLDVVLSFRRVVVARRERRAR